MSEKLQHAKPYDPAPLPILKLIVKWIQMVDYSGPPFSGNVRSDFQHGF